MSSSNFSEIRIPIDAEPDSVIEVKPGIYVTVVSSLSDFTPPYEDKKALTKFVLEHEPTLLAHPSYSDGNVIPIRGFMTRKVALPGGFICNQLLVEAFNEAHWVSIGNCKVCKNK